MTMMKGVILFSVFFCLLVKAQTQSTNLDNTKIKDLKTHRCPMLSRFCKFEISSSNKLNNTRLNFTDLIVTVNGTKYFSFLKLEACGDQPLHFLTKKDCLDYTDDSNLSKIFIIIKSIVVGKGIIRVENKITKEIIDSSILITQPERLIDFIHRIFIIIFQTVISTSMGILIDVKTILKIIKLPKPVLIGFLTQYTCMPLVSC